MRPLGEGIRVALGSRSGTKTKTLRQAAREGGLRKTGCLKTTAEGRLGGSVGEASDFRS